MKRALSFAVSCLPVFAMACTEGTAAPDPLAGPSEDVELTPELSDYDIDPSEYVATEGDPEFAVWPRLASNPDGDETDYLVDEIGDPSAALVPELDERDNLIAEEESVPVTPTSLAAGRLHLLADSKNPTWWTRTFPSPFKVKNDPRNGRGERICRGSPYNCFAPNPHSDANRFHPPSATEDFYNKKIDLKAYEATGWPLKPGSRMYDGAGTVLLTDLNPSNAKVNFGMRRELTVGGQSDVYVYVWKHSGLLSGKLEFASGWVKKTDFVYAAGDPFDRGTLKGYAPKKPSDKDATEQTRSIRTAEDLGDCPSGPTFDAAPRCYRKLNDARKKRFGEGYNELKVKPPVGATEECVKNCKVGDYLVRSKGVLNLAYATPRLGGLATETRIVKEGDTFQRIVSKNKKWRFLLAVPLFKPASKNVVVGKMFFAYGHWGDRYGWMALDALRVKSDKTAVAGPGAPGCEGKADGLYCLGSSAYECTSANPGRNVSCTDPSKTCVTAADGKASIDADGNPVCQ